MLRVNLVHENIYKIVKKYNLKIIEDAAQSIGFYEGKIQDTIQMLVLLVNPMKVLNSGEVALLTNSKKIYNKLICLRHEQ